jgi:putative flippase GtrA
VLNLKFDLASLRQLFVFYKVAIVNTVFGYSLYAALVYLGLNPFVAQIISQMSGMAFNYFMYRRHVFQDSESAVFRYICAYAGNYGLNLGFLAILRTVFRSAYVAGLLATVAASLINYAALKFLVFRKTPNAKAV